MWGQPLQGGQHAEPALRVAARHACFASCCITRVFLFLLNSPVCAACVCALQEIYNEELRDLLGKGPPKDKKHAVGGLV